MTPLHKKAVILGAAGFIGTHLADNLTRKGYRVVCFDWMPSVHWPETCDVLCGDFSQPSDQILREFEGAIVFHLVGTSKPSNTTSNIGRELGVDVAATLDLLERTKGTECRWVFASSGGTVYGESQDPLISEDHPTFPMCSYGIAKLTIEKYFSLYRKIHGTDFVVGRLANPFGPRQPSSGGQGLIAAVVERILDRQPIEIWGDGENIRDYIYIDDAINGLVSIAEAGLSGDVYNVGSGKGTSINEIVEQVAAAFGMRPIVVNRPRRRIDVRRNALSIDKIKRTTGWSPQYTLAGGIDMYRRSLRERSLSGEEV